MSVVRSKVATILGAGVMVAGLAVAAPHPAAAADGPTVSQLLAKCNNGTDRCVFHVNSVEKYLGPEKQVSPSIKNCTSVNQSYQKTWTDSTSTGTTTTEAVSISGAFGAFTAGYTKSTGKSWEYEHTESHSSTVWVAPWKTAYLAHQTPKVKTRGYYQLNFGKRFYGHYVWYVNDITITGIDTANPYGPNPVHREVPGWAQC
jgi:hypothetical protein